MSDFPAARFREAGATADEIALLAREWDRSDVVVQSSMAGWFKSVATGDIGDYIETLREGGHFAEDELLDATEPDGADDGENGSGDHEDGPEADRETDSTAE